MNCAGNALGSYHCRPHFTMFRVEGFLQACRALMIAAICLGSFGSIFAFAGMKCTRIGGTDQMKAKVACLAGVLFIFSGACSLTGCSLYAHKTTSEFFDPTLVSAKYELGTALFVGWAGALLCMAGGFMFCCTFSTENIFSRPSYPYNAAASSNMSSRTKTKVATKLVIPQGSSQGYNKNSYV
ncbi:claudin-10 isoform X2 [Mixophyes fleayi]